MRFFTTTTTAARALRANAVRSSLTILGIVIGITAIMLIVSLGQGAQNLILGEIQGLGADTIVIRPGREPKGPNDFASTLFADSLKKRDIEWLSRKENVPDLVAIAPSVIVADAVSYGGEVTHPTVFGWDASFMMKIAKVKIAQGAIFDESDIKQEAAVALIGHTVASDLFAGDDPVGRSIRIGTRNFRVVGVFAESVASPFFNTDKMVLVPYTSAQTYLTGKDYFQEVMLKVSSGDAVDRSVSDIKRSLRELHNITDPDKDDFYVETQQGSIKQVATILNVLTAFLSAVVAISLVVGGIGVMNVMLVSVTERTREIGLRKALGARDRDILTQFLAEAVFLTLLGGLIGIFLGVTLGFGMSLILTKALAVDWAFTFPWSAAGIGLGVAGGVGLVFGIYPARKAAQKSPIEALRYE